MRAVRQIVGFVIAVAVAAVGSAFLSSHFVLRALEGLGVDVALSERFAMYAHDVWGMGPIAGALAAVAFLIAFPVAALVVRFVPALRTLGYVLAGAAAIGVALGLMEATLGMMPVAGARTLGGLIAQAAAGALGGYAFAQVTRRRGRAEGRPGAGG